MTLRQAHEDAILTGEDITFIRRVLSDCSSLLTWAGDHADPQLKQLLTEATWATTADKRSPGGLTCYINLAIDYLDFASPARRRR
jgi:hypothetical protein